MSQENIEIVKRAITAINERDESGTMLSSCLVGYRRADTHKSKSQYRP